MLQWVWGLAQSTLPMVMWQMLMIPSMELTLEMTNAC